MKSVDGMEGRELDSAVQREAMDSVIGWIPMEHGTREPVFVPRQPNRIAATQPKWVPPYSTEPVNAAAIDRRMKELGLTDLYNLALKGNNRTPENKCRAALIAVRSARLFAGPVVAVVRSRQEVGS